MQKGCHWQVAAGELGGEEHALERHGGGIHGDLGNSESSSVAGGSEVQGISKLMKSQVSSGNQVV